MSKLFLGGIAFCLLMSNYNEVWGKEAFLNDHWGESGVKVGDRSYDIVSDNGLLKYRLKDKKEAPSCEWNTKDGKNLYSSYENMKRIAEYALDLKYSGSDSANLDLFSGTNQIGEKLLNHLKGCNASDKEAVLNGILFLNRSLRYVSDDNTFKGRKCVTKEKEILDKLLGNQVIDADMLKKASADIKFYWGKLWGGKKYVQNSESSKIKKMLREEEAKTKKLIEERDEKTLENAKKCISVGLRDKINGNKEILEAGLDEYNNTSQFFEKVGFSGNGAGTWRWDVFEKVNTNNKAPGEIFYERLNSLSKTIEYKSVVRSILIRYINNYLGDIEKVSELSINGVQDLIRYLLEDMYKKWDGTSDQNSQVSDKKGFVGKFRKDWESLVWMCFASFVCRVIENVVLIDPKITYKVGDKSMGIAEILNDIETKYEKIEKYIQSKAEGGKDSEFYETFWSSFVLEGSLSRAGGGTKGKNVEECYGEAKKNIRNSIERITWAIGAKFSEIEKKIGNNGTAAVAISEFCGLIDKSKSIYIIKKNDSTGRAGSIELSNKDSERIRYGLFVTKCVDIVIKLLDASCNNILKKNGGGIDRNALDEEVLTWLDSILSSDYVKKIKLFIKDAGYDSVGEGDFYVSSRLAECVWKKISKYVIDCITKDRNVSYDWAISFMKSIIEKMNGYSSNDRDKSFVASMCFRVGTFLSNLFCHVQSCALSSMRVYDCAKYAEVFEKLRESIKDEQSSCALVIKNVYNSSITLDKGNNWVGSTEKVYSNKISENQKNGEDEFLIALLKMANDINNNDTLGRLNEAYNALSSKLREKKVSVSLFSKSLSSSYGKEVNLGNVLEKKKNELEGRSGPTPKQANDNFKDNRGAFEKKINLYNRQQQRGRFGANDKQKPEGNSEKKKKDDGQKPEEDVENKEEGKGQKPDADIETQKTVDGLIEIIKKGKITDKEKQRRWGEFLAKVEEKDFFVYINYIKAKTSISDEYKQLYCLLRLVKILILVRKPQAFGTINTSRSNVIPNLVAEIAREFRIKKTEALDLFKNVSITYLTDSFKLQICGNDSKKKAKLNAVIGKIQRMDEEDFEDNDEFDSKKR